MADSVSLGLRNAMSGAGERYRGYRPASLVYAVLVAMTLVTWWIGKAGLSGLGVSLLVLSFALLKGQMIGEWFIGLRPLQGIWRWIITLWLLTTGTLIAVAFMLAQAN